MGIRAATIHSWDVSLEEAKSIQSELRHRVERRTLLGPIRYVAGVDIGFTGLGMDPTANWSRGDQAQGLYADEEVRSSDEGGPTRPRHAANLVARAAAIVISYPSLQPVDLAIAERQVKFPYRPGFLSFREAPSAIAALESLRTEPNLLVIDGQGIAHPRRLGIAAHLGVLFDIPTIGCAKSKLIGSVGEVGEEVGSWAPMLDGGETVGAAVRTRRGSKPVYVSIGHKVDLQTAIQLILALARGHRMPEPTRLAHLAAAGRLPWPGT